jgi:hypothetical protein
MANTVIGDTVASDRSQQPAADLACEPATSYRGLRCGIAVSMWAETVDADADEACLKKVREGSSVSKRAVGGPHH